MRLLLLTNLYPPQNLGGFGLCLERLCRGLEALGYKTLVVCSDAAYLGPIGLNPKICRILELLGSYDGGISKLTDWREEKRRNKKNQKTLKRIIKCYEPNACLIGNLDLLGIELMDVVLGSNIPTIQHVGFMGAPMPLGSNQLKHPAYRMAFASNEVKILLRKQGFNVEGYPVAYPPLTSDVAPRPSDCNSKQLRVCYSGLLMQSKGVHILLEAMARLNQVGVYIKLSIAGKAFSPNYEDELRDYSEKVGISKQITWYGFMEGDQLQNFYQAQEVLVFPSLHPESFGMVVAEAMATGVVPISSGVGGAIEVITHGRNGILIPPDNSEELAKQLAWCVNNKASLKTMAKRATKDSIKLYAPKRSATVLHKCFKQISRDLYA